MHGYGVMAAASPGEALQALDDAGRVDLLLTDVVMPGGSGVELAEAVARARPDVRVVFMSGYPEDILRDNPHFPNTRLVPSPLPPKISSPRSARLYRSPRFTEVMLSDQGWKKRCTPLWCSSVPT